MEKKQMNAGGFLVFVVLGSNSKSNFEIIFERFGQKEKSSINL